MMMRREQTQTRNDDDARAAYRCYVGAWGCYVHCTAAKSLQPCASLWLSTGSSLPRRGARHFYRCMAVALAAVGPAVWL